MENKNIQRNLATALAACFPLLAFTTNADEIGSPTSPEQEPSTTAPSSLGTFEPQGPVLGGGATDPAVDKSRFHLFNPTPDENLRDINALYNGPYTVDAGHLQIETVIGLLALDHNTEAGADVTTRFLSLASTTIRLGLLNNLDFGVTIPPHIRIRTHDRVANTHRQISGVGDVTLRSKYNLWGNDGGSSAFGLVGFAKLPTNQNGIGNNHVEGGFGLPLALELPKGWWLGITPEFHCFHDTAGGGYHLNFASTVFLWHKIAGNLSGYIESANWVNAERGSPWISTLDVGLTYVWGKHVQLDAGAYIGMTRPANDVTPFLGVSLRFNPSYALVQREPKLAGDQTKSKTLIAIVLGIGIHETHENAQFSHYDDVSSRTRPPSKDRTEYKRRTERRSKRGFRSPASPVGNGRMRRSFGLRSEGRRLASVAGIRAKRNFT